MITRKHIEILFVIFVSCGNVAHMEQQPAQQIPEDPTRSGPA
jgi:hypothetical protein